MKKRRYITQILAACGVVGAIVFSFTHGESTHAPESHIALPPATPFADTVAGTGIVEANTRDIEVGSYLSGIVSKLLVTEGQEVKEGDALFVIDPRESEANVAVTEAALLVAKAAEADALNELKRARSMKTGSSISKSEADKRRYAYEKAAAARQQAEATLQAAKIDLERHTITSPVTGTVLKVRIRQGEFVVAGSTFAPMVVGNERPLHLRVSIDENDAWRFNQKAEAVAVIRSNRELSFPLTFVQVEPYVQPKRELSGSLQEKVDTRILEVIYRFTPGKRPVYIGQQMDVFINAQPESEKKENKENQ